MAVAEFLPVGVGGGGAPVVLTGGASACEVENRDSILPTSLAT